MKEGITVYIGYDSREAIAAEVCKYSIERNTFSSPVIKYLKHRELRKLGLFKRGWLMESDTGNYRDLIDSKPFSTEFSHTRFLVPHLHKYKGWALFMDCDMIFQSDIKDLFKLCDDRYAVMCVKHNHHPATNTNKMDGRAQLHYYRKNWSSFVLWNCEHSANKHLTPEKVNFMAGADLHAFNWLDDSQIGSIPFLYNYISGVSPAIPISNGKQLNPLVIHYTEGGPWFEECRDVPFAGKWIDEYNRMIENAENSHFNKKMEKT